MSSNETTGITLSCSDGKWSYQKEEGGTSTRFNGTVKMGENVATSTNKLVIAATTGNPTLIFEKVEIKPTGRRRPDHRRRLRADPQHDGRGHFHP